MKITTKIESGIYLHIKTNKYIMVWVGSSSSCWNIFNDAEGMDEFEIGFNTKWQAIDFLNKLEVK